MYVTIYLKGKRIRHLNLHDRFKKDSRGNPLLFAQLEQKVTNIAKDTAGKDYLAHSTYYEEYEKQKPIYKAYNFMPKSQV